MSVPITFKLHDKEVNPPPSRAAYLKWFKMEKWLRTPWVMISMMFVTMVWIFGIFIINTEDLGLAMLGFVFPLSWLGLIYWLSLRVQITKKEDLWFLAWLSVLPQSRPFILKWIGEDSVFTQHFIKQCKIEQYKYHFRKLVLDHWPWYGFNINKSSVDTPLLDDFNPIDFDKNLDFKQLDILNTPNEIFEWIFSKSRIEHLQLSQSLPLGGKIQRKTRI